jgi:hypothetical protein
LRIGGGHRGFNSIRFLLRFREHGWSRVFGGWLPQIATHPCVCGVHNYDVLRHAFSTGWGVGMQLGDASGGLFLQDASPGWEGGRNTAADVESKGLHRVKPQECRRKAAFLNGRATGLAAIAG